MRQHDPDFDATVRAAVHQYLDSDADVELIVPVEDVFPGHLALLADRAIFLKKVFDGVEVRREYLFAEADGVEVCETFGGVEVRGKVGDKELRLRRLKPDHAAFVTGRFRGEAVELPVSEPTIRACTLPEKATRLDAPVAVSTAGESDVWFAPPAERNSQGMRGSIDTPLSSAATASPALSADRSSGYLTPILLIGVAAAVGWYFVDSLDTRLQALEAQRDADKALRVEVSDLIEEIGVVEARIATLSDDLAVGQGGLSEIRLGGSAPELFMPGVTTNELYAVRTQGSPARGPAAAWVTLIEIADFQCNHCAQVQPMIAELRRTYDRDLRIVYKHFPLSNHAHAMTAARAGECARDQGRFWRFHDYIYAHQDQLGTQEIEDLVKRAGGISLVKWRACMQAGEVDDRIARDKEEALALGITGAPTFLINGRLLAGVQPLAALEKVIDEELERAKSSGVSKAQYYRKMVMERGR